MLFNKKFKELQADICDLRIRLGWLDNRANHLSIVSRVVDLEQELKRLVEDLGLVRRETHKIEYIKKGGPESQ